jgi:hypothetical protein
MGEVEDIHTQQKASADQWMERMHGGIVWGKNDAVGAYLRNPRYVRGWLGAESRN